jgi:type II secretory pathway pseudopilin PulG
MKSDANRKIQSAPMDAFSLVEVTVAIGIFAFVVVGVLGLMPAGMRMQSESAAESRGLLISQELLAAVRVAPNLSNIVVRDGPGLTTSNNQTINLANGNTVVVGFPSQTTVPYFLWGGTRSVGSPDTAWFGGELHAGAVSNAIDTLARLSATNLGNGLYRVMVEVRSPASLPLTNTRPVTFSTLVYSP